MIFCFAIASALWAEENIILDDSLEISNSIETGDTISIDTISIDTIWVNAVADDALKVKAETKKSSLSLNPLKLVKKVFDYLFVDVEEGYIEKQPYYLQALLQNNNTYEIYQLTDNEGNSIRFAPEMSAKIGPYAGYSLFFYGISVDVAHLSDGAKRSESTFSLYSLPAGIDIFIRKSGDNFRIRRVDIEGVDTSPLENKKFDGISSTITGFNTYYIFNHKRFSYPAGFNQSTVQRKSAGTALAGIGYTHHTLDIDWQKLGDLAQSTLGMDVSDKIDRDALFEKVVYTDFSLSGGYAYNHVFKKNWLFSSSLSLALAYKHSSGKVDMGTFMLKDFSFNNFNIDGIGRFGLVYNNLKWFAGASVICHTYNYKKSKFYTNNSFGSLNLYVGFNFWRKK